jgi:hypothetical protein
VKTGYQVSKFEYQVSRFGYRVSRFEYQVSSIKICGVKKTKYRSTNSVIARHEANFEANRKNAKDKTVIPVQTGTLMRLVAWISSFSVYDTQSTR